MVLIFGILVLEKSAEKLSASDTSDCSMLKCNGDLRFRYLNSRASCDKEVVRERVILLDNFMRYTCDCSLNN